ncbi:TSUP family transporter [Pseudotabrizicola sp. L79]|uniref:TSUP family transporter n=1 Tax=Pseudotabrizicola sp. L79 TaxID=3118402 RepID=UPI002F94DF02
MALLSFAALALATSFISGIFGMAGGMLLMGGLLLLFPVADAMVLHGITQMASNGWRAILWHRYIVWPIVGRYALGLISAGALFLSLHLVPDQRFVFLILGALPFISRVIPARWLPQATRRGGAELCGFVGTSFQLLSGVSGPLVDVFFVRTPLDRRAIVATKAACQVITHLAKLLYFGVLIGGATSASVSPLIMVLAVGCAIIGTTLARGFLERLSDHNFRRYTWWVVMSVGAVYLARGVSAFV